MPMTKASIERAENRAFFEKLVTMRERYLTLQQSTDRHMNPFADDLPIQADKAEVNGGTDHES